MFWGASAHGEQAASGGCVERLLQSPVAGKVVVERAGVGKGRVHADFEYPAVEGCSSLGRVPQVRVETKTAGRWRPASDAWVDAPNKETASGTVEVTYSGGGAVVLRCEGGRRPPVREQVRTRVKNLATGGNLGQSPVRDFAASYEPASSARC